MCGIAGIWHRDGHRAADRAVLASFAAQLQHRGPDHTGVWSEGQIGLAHCRLAIIDLHPESNQPMSYADGRYVIAFNGEIYNYLELRETLASHGYTFRTHSDTEVLLAAYAHYGTECLPHLRGMFAFAIWDRTARTLFLARDRIGKKPLKYAWIGDTFIFASELKALLTYPGFTPGVAWEDVGEYLLHGYIPSSGTGFRGIQKLPPATGMLIAPDQQRSWTYWDLAYEPKRSAPFAGEVEACHATLREAVRLRLRSDVPLGVFLSGGVDSSLVTALMRDLDVATLKTFSIHFRDERADETRYARFVAERMATEHHEFTVDEDLLQHLPHAVRMYEEPFADAAGFATYFLSSLARRDVTVALSGEGGDEAFAGYHHYTHGLRLRRLLGLPAALRHGLARALAVSAHLLPARARARTGLLASVLHAPSAAWYTEMNAAMPWYVRRALAPFQLPDQAAAAAYARTLQQPRQRAFLDAMTYADVHTYLPYCLNVKVDIASMQHALEVRCPFLDHTVLEYAARLPAAYRWQDGIGKRILKEVARRYYPDDFVFRTKQGFGVPYAGWLAAPQGQFLREAVADLARQYPEVFPPRAIDTLLRQHAQEGRYAHQVWILALLGVWLATFHRGG